MAERIREERHQLQSTRQHFFTAEMQLMKIYRELLNVFLLPPNACGLIKQQHDRYLCTARRNEMNIKITEVGKHYSGPEFH